MADGSASAEDIDRAVRFGFGLRFMVRGPLAQRDLAGLDLASRIQTNPDDRERLDAGRQYLLDLAAAGHSRPRHRPRPARLARPRPRRSTPHRRRTTRPPPPPSSPPGNVPENRSWVSSGSGRVSGCNLARDSAGSGHGLYVPAGHDVPDAHPHSDANGRSAPGCRWQGVRLHRQPAFDQLLGELPDQRRAARGVAATRILPCRASRW